MEKRRKLKLYQKLMEFPIKMLIKRAKIACSWKRLIQDGHHRRELAITVSLTAVTFLIFLVEK